jgi:hypothetical protein
VNAELIERMKRAGEEAVRAVGLDDIFGPQPPWTVATYSTRADRVVGFALRPSDGALIIIEMCDEYFHAVLHRDQVSTLIEFLTAVRDQMPEVTS